MSSTEDVRLQRFYDEYLEPAAKRLRERGVSFFPLRPDSGAETWYSVPLDGGNFTTLDAEECGDVLRKMWEDQSLPELVELVNGLMKLSSELKISEKETADISPFIYVMY